MVLQAYHHGVSDYIQTKLRIASVVFWLGKNTTWNVHVSDHIQTDFCIYVYRYRSISSLPTARSHGECLGGVVGAVGHVESTELSSRSVLQPTTSNGMRDGCININRYIEMSMF